jgi:UDP:flavonoid glycosyltransferase YjiC (YdhE family)
MVRILLVTPSAGGNVPPTLAIAAQLLADGHDVLAIGHPQLQAAFSDAGVDFRPFTRARRWSPVTDRPGVRSMLGWLPLASDRGIEGDVGDELARRPVDVVVVDCMIPVALRAARRSGARVVLLVHAFSGYWIDLWSRSNPLGAWLRLTRAHPASHPADLAVVLTAPELDVVDRSRVPAARVTQTGPIVPEVTAAASTGAAAALVSFSTISYPGQRGALQRTLDALASRPLTAIATVAPSLAPEHLRVPENVEVRGLVPHAQLLPHVRLLIGHGGHGTTMAAIAHGVPVLVIAMSSVADQPLVGAAVERAGVGASLPRESSVAEISQALTTVLADPSLAVRAAALGAPWRHGGPARAAAAAISGPS